MNTNGKPTLADALQTLERAVATIPPVELPGLLGHLEKVKAMGWGRMLTGPHNGQEDNGLLTIKEVAQQLKVSEYRAYELVRNGEIKKISVGEKSVRVKPSDLLAYIDRTAD